MSNESDFYAKTGEMNDPGATSDFSLHSQLSKGSSSLDVTFIYTGLNSITTDVLTTDVLDKIPKDAHESFVLLANAKIFTTSQILNFISTYQESFAEAISKAGYPFTLGFMQFLIHLGVITTNEAAIIFYHKKPNLLSVIQGYKMKGILGKGGFGLVVELQKNLSDDRMALKLLLDDENPEKRALFFNEVLIAQHLGRIDPSTNRQIDDHFLLFPSPPGDDPCCFAIMEKIVGEEYEDALNAQLEPNPEEAIRIVYEVACALRTAHREKIAHGDVKPKNILLQVGNRVKLIDNGISNVQDDDLRAQFNSRNMGGVPIASVDPKTAVIRGTPGYMSRRICEGNLANYDDDLYALGITLYRALGGKDHIVRGKNDKETFFSTLQHTKEHGAPKVIPKLSTKHDVKLQQIYAMAVSGSCTADDLVKEIERLYPHLPKQSPHNKLEKQRNPLRSPMAVIGYVCAATVVAVAAVLSLGKREVISDPTSKIVLKDIDTHPALRSQPISLRFSQYENGQKEIVPIVGGEVIDLNDIDLAITIYSKDNEVVGKIFSINESDYKVFAKNFVPDRDFSAISVSQPDRLCTYYQNQNGEFILSNSYSNIVCCSATGKVLYSGLQYINPQNLLMASEELKKEAIMRFAEFDRVYRSLNMDFNSTSNIPEGFDYPGKFIQSNFGPMQINEFNLRKITLHYNEMKKVIEKLKAELGQ